MFLIETKRLVRRLPTVLGFLVTLFPSSPSLPCMQQHAECATPPIALSCRAAWEHVAGGETAQLLMWQQRTRMALLLRSFEQLAGVHRPSSGHSSRAARLSSGSWTSGMEWLVLDYTF